MTRGWTTAAAARDRLRKRWDSGALLTALANGEPFPPFDIPVRGPQARELGDVLGEAREWVDGLERHSRGGGAYELEYTRIGGRLVGRTALPSRLRVTAYEQAWRFLGVRPEVDRYRQTLELVANEPAVHDWVVRRPIRALSVGEDWPALVAAHQWLVTAKDSGRYLREVSAPGVHTKFIEQHRAVLGELLGARASASGFITDLGLRGTPELLRVRCAPEVLGLPRPLTEVAVRSDELAEVVATPRTAVVVENEITYLSAPLPEGGIVLWGRGFGVHLVGSLSWLEHIPVHYWGDIDTHGFAILDRLRTSLPQTRSFLMDRATLVRHADRWSREPSPGSARLSHLHEDELELYHDLVADHLGDRVRLEQERIDWAWALDRLPYDVWRASAAT